MKYVAYIYRYTFILDRSKVYIGQTRNPKERHLHFLNLKHTYAGKKLERYRQNFGPDKFKYEVIAMVEADTLEELQEKINKLERYYIIKYDAIEKGFNTSKGGGKCYRNVATIIEELPDSKIPEEDPDEKVEIVKVKKRKYNKYIDSGLFIEKTEDMKLSQVQKESRESLRKALVSRKDTYNEDSEHRYFLKSDWENLLALLYQKEKMKYGDRRCVPVVKYESLEKVKFFNSISEAYYDYDGWYSYQTIRNWCRDRVNGYMTQEDFFRIYLPKNYDLVAE